MATIGAEVGQKMRSAIKAKLLELNCYVDDELPDYVMVMVANKRTKSQMKDDLQLFLSNKTASFVDWLHIVLKKLKEVTVTNPDVYKKPPKRKSDELPNVNVKKEKKEKKSGKKETKTEPEQSTESVFKSLTDDLPINANRLSEQRKIIIMKENKSNNSRKVMQDNFDIPLLSEVNMSTEEELEDLENKIKSVKSRLGLLVESDEEEDCIKLKPEPDELLPTENENKGESKVESTTTAAPQPPKRTEHSRITFNEEHETRRKSILDRLGKRRSGDNEEAASSKRNRIDLSDFRKEDSSKTRSDRREKRFRRDDKSKEGVLSRVGVMSKVSVPVKAPEEPEEPFKNREVPSVVKIKPRVIPPDAPQANKNLLLKAVAEAQKSIAQAPKVGNNLKPDALYTKKYKEKRKDEPSSGKKLPEVEKNKIKKFLAVSDDDSKRDETEEYIPTPIKRVQESTTKYIPTSKTNDSDDSSVENGKVKQQFIVTLDGIERTKYKDLANEEPKPSVKSRLDKKKSPSPIIFDKVENTIKGKPNIPDKLPLIHASPAVKNKERCKYWPSCRQGDKCEFVHPTTTCEKFPHCKFGDKCLFLHPTCKFGSSCTRRGCVYSHAAKGTGPSPVKLAGPVQTCKFFPNCTNVNCAFYHPKPCKFGKYCKNQADCTFSHTFVPNKSSLTWRSK